MPLGRQRADHAADRNALQKEPERCRQGADVVDRADQGEQGRGRGHCRERPASDLVESREQGDGAPGDDERRDHDRNAAALRRRSLV